jgi:hypothetical protein
MMMMMPCDADLVVLGLAVCLGLRGSLSFVMAPASFLGS